MQTDPDKGFIELDLIQSKMKAINPSFEKKEMEVIANFIDKLPVENSKVVTVVKGMTTISINELKDKIRAFYKRKLKGTKSTKEISLFTQKNKGICKNCGKQGHKADVCQSKMNTSGTNANCWRNYFRKEKSRYKLPTTY